MENTTTTDAEIEMLAYITDRGSCRVRDVLRRQQAKSTGLSIPDLQICLSYLSLTNRVRIDGAWVAAV